MPGVPPGEFILGAHVPGYQSYLSPPIHNTGATSMDLGAILLEPCGVVVLEVSDTAGNPLRHYWAYCNGEQMGGHSGNQMDIAPVKKCFWLLPVGPATIRIEADGHHRQTISVVLEPAQPLEIKVELQPR